MNPHFIQNQIQSDLHHYSQHHPWDLSSQKVQSSSHTQEYLHHCAPFIEEESSCTEFNRKEYIQQYLQQIKK